MKKQWAWLCAIIVVVTNLMGCGVKGDPLPPERPVELGRGRPTYKRAAERIKVVPQVDESPEPDEEDETEEEE